MSASTLRLKYDQAKLLKLLRYLESGRSSHSRKTSSSEIAAAGSSSFPLLVDERKFYLDWAIQEGLLDGTNGYFHSLHDHKPEEGFAIGYELTVAGHKFLYSHREAISYRRWARQIVDNVPTIVVAVFSALVISWAKDWFGPIP